ncbi:LamB/YcsF family protein, partial [Mycolicibacterium sphagni]|uniref:LamB/YcsF family protein n=1 Tax=Mycolicibacterium sphagni TaxID=1786 RepID=UPI0021F34652
AGSAFFAEADKLGLRTVSEVFADRAYRPDGQLVPAHRLGGVRRPGLSPRRPTGAMVRTGRVIATDGSAVPAAVESICVHGDSPSAVDIARAVRQRLLGEGISVTAFV